jgi:hypothetical protein
MVRSHVFPPEKINVQRSPGSPLSLPDWIHKGWVWQSHSYRLQNLALKAEIILTHSEVAWDVRDPVYFTRGRHHERYCDIAITLQYELRFNTVEKR